MTKLNRSAGDLGPRISGGANRNLNISGGLEPGMDFGPRYRIDKLVGAGGMGNVYKAFDKELSRTVALKTLLPELVSDYLLTQRFKQEFCSPARFRTETFCVFTTSARSTA